MFYIDNQRNVVYGDCGNKNCQSMWILSKIFYDAALNDSSKQFYCSAGHHVSFKSQTKKEQIGKVQVTYNEKLDSGVPK